MTEYALSTNLYTYAQAQADSPFFGWPVGSGEAELLGELAVGDIIIPKFSASPAWASASEGDLLFQQQYCEAIGVDYHAARESYNEEIAGGEGGVPFLFRVTGQLENDTRPPGVDWACVSIENVELEKALSSKEFLLLRAIPSNIAAQFKGAVARGRHLQELPAGAASAVLDAAKLDDRSPFLRKYSVVEAQSAQGALQTLVSAGRTPVEGDRAFLAAPGGLLGVHDVLEDGTLKAASSPISRTPDELLELFEEAKSKAQAKDQFAPGRVLNAAAELKDLLEGPSEMLPIDDFGRFYDRYGLLASKVTQALAIASRAATGGSVGGEESDDDLENESEIDEISALQGLTIEDVKNELADGVVFPDAVLAEAVTALRAGKHLLLGGPPGTGKSTLAEALSRAVVEINYDVATATADWTTFDTIGGYMPTSDGPLRFQDGVVLRAIRRGRWLIIDELNRADIDKAFGPLFTLLAGSAGGTPSRRVVLPYERPDGKNVTIDWAEKRSASNNEFVLTPGWRLIGTLNLSDKASLFQLSFAFLRRFAVVDVPLPPPSNYRAFFETKCGELSDVERDNVIDVAMDLAKGPRPLGPAVLEDIAAFMVTGLAETASGASNYQDDVDAFVTAVRLFAVPQYEGSDASDGMFVLNLFKSRWPDRTDQSWEGLKQALAAVALS